MGQGVVPMLVRSAGRAVLLAAILFVLVAGCSDKRTAEVSGMVRVDGVPVEKGSITFFPVDEQGQTSGSPIKDGKYRATKVSTGVMLVQITDERVTGQKKLYDTPDSPVRPTYKNILPDKYHEKSELRFEVKPGNNEKDWDLSLK
jgi:hypothetical protein